MYKDFHSFPLSCLFYSTFFLQEITQTVDLHRRAELVLENADVLDARVFVTANDIVSENAKLNLAFVANLFKNHSGLDSSEVELPEEAISDLETREERSELRQTQPSKRFASFPSGRPIAVAQSQTKFKLLSVVNVTLTNLKLRFFHVSFYTNL